MAAFLTHDHMAALWQENRAGVVISQHVDSQSGSESHGLPQSWCLLHADNIDMPHSPWMSLKPAVALQIMVEERRRGG